MIAGHFGFAAGVKAAEPQVPLWSLMLATVWLDIVFVPLLVAGVECSVGPARSKAGHANRHSASPSAIVMPSSTFIATQ
jgi:hypothetical protein